MDYTDSTDTTEQRHRREQEHNDRVHAAAIRAALCAARGLPLSSGCIQCGAPVSPRCEHCIGVECASGGGAGGSND